MKDIVKAIKKGMKNHKELPIQYYKFYATEKMFAYGFKGNLFTIKNGEFYYNNMKVVVVKDLPMDL